MAVESPADILFLGINRVSVEAALYARFLGYQATLVGDHLCVEQFQNEHEPFEVSKVTTTLGRRAIEAQGEPIATTTFDSSSALKQDYLQKLLDSDLLAENRIENCRSIVIRQAESELPEDIDEDVEYDTTIFQVEIEVNSDETPEPLEIDVLIDCRKTKEVDSPEVTCDFEMPNERCREAESESKSLITEIDDFYFLGFANSHRRSGSTFSQAMVEIRDLFRLLTDNANTDLHR